MPEIICVYAFVSISGFLVLPGDHDIFCYFTNKFLLGEIAAASPHSVDQTGWEKTGSGASGSRRSGSDGRRKAIPAF